MSDPTFIQLEKLKKELIEKDKRIEKQSETILKLKEDNRVLKDENDYLNKRVETLQSHLIQFMSKEEKIAKQDPDFYKIKLVLLGDNSVGKTSFINRFAYKKFDSEYNPTIGAEITKTRLRFKGIIFEIMIWDIAGQVLFENLAQQFILEADLAILLYDITRINTFMNIENWNNYVKKIVGKKIPTLLVGNKSDLEGLRMVFIKNALKLARELEIPFIETSAKDDTNIKDTLIMLLSEFIEPSS